MLQKFANSLTNILLENQIVKEEDREIYFYGFEAMMSTVVNAVLVFIIGIVVGLLKETIIFVVCFATLRIYCGGYHAKTHLGCITSFLFLYGSAMLFITFFPIEYGAETSVMLGFLSLVFIFKYAPIEHKNRPFVENEYSTFRKLSRIIASLELTTIIIICIFFTNIIKMALTISSSMFCVLFILALAKIIEGKR